MAAETIVIDVVANFKNQTSSGMNSAKQSADKFTESVQKAKKETDRLGGTHAKPTVSLVDRASSTISKIDRGLTSFAGKTFKAGVKILDYATTPLRAIKNALFSIKSLVLAIGAGWAANQLIANPLSLADAYSSAKIGFSTLLGDTGGQEMMNKLDEFAKATPFKTSGVISNAQKMMAMGWNVDTLIDDMKTIGDAAAATGKMDQGLESIVRALSQIKTKGKLSTEELNQLSEAGISAKAMLAEQLGYGTGDSGIAAMTADLEKGLIGSETAIKALLEGMKKFEGTMEKTANETVEGLKSQLEDTFEINIFRKWGQGLQEGAKRGLGSILELLEKSEGTLAKFGDTVYEIGRELSNWAADKLEGTIDKILEITSSREFKQATLGGKIKILWSELIAEPFGKWWDTTGQPWMVEKMSSLGKGLGTGISNVLIGMSNAILDFLGEDKIETKSESIGGGFASGFLEGFKGKKVWEAITKAGGAALKAGFKTLFSGNALTNIIATGLSIKVAAGILRGISKVQHAWYGEGNVGGLFGTSGIGYTGGGIKGFLGGASTASGSLVGSGLIGGLAKLGSAAGSTAYTGGGLAIAGAGTAAGIIGGVAGLGNSVVDLTKAVNAQTKNDEKLYGTRAATKAGMVGTGALIGTLIAPGIGTAIGAGLGGLATFLAGDKLADAISGVSKSTAELNAEAEELASKRLDEKFGKITLSAEQLASRVQEVFGVETLTRINKFNQSMADLSKIQDSVFSYQDTIGYISARINAGEELSASDIEDYKTALSGYADSVAQLLTANKTATRSAFELLYGDDKDGLQAITKTMNSTYTKLEAELAEKSAKLNEVIGDAFSDGKITIDEEKKINEVVSQIKAIQDKINERVQMEAQAQSNATYDLLEKKYTDSDLTLNSFKQLMSELDAQSKIDQQAYDDAYIKAKAELDVELELGEIDQTEYDKKIKEVEQKWREGKALSVKKTVEVSWNVIGEKYGSTIKNFGKYVDTIYGSSGSGLMDHQIVDVINATKTTSGQYGINGKYYMNEVLKWNENTVKEFKEMQDEILESLGVDDALRKEMAEMYEILKPQEEELLELKASYEKAGVEIPKWITDTLADIENVKLMSGDMDSFYKLIGEEFATADKEYAQRLLKEAGENLPESFKEGLEKGIAAVEATEVDLSTNLKLTADKKNIDTSDFDIAMQGLIEKLENEGILKINKNGEVTIKTKDGHIDTTGLDKDTKAAIEKLENDGVIQIDKNGNVTIHSIVDTSEAKTKTKSEVTSALGQDQNVNATAKVSISSTTSGEVAAANASYSETKTATDTAYGKDLYETPRVKIDKISVSGLGNALAGAWAGLKSTIQSKFSGSIYTNPQVKYRIGVSPTSKSDANDGKKANGGYVDKAVRAIVGEAGPEMIIPLSANRRQRGKYLWERAGRAMGLFGASGDENVYLNANGGLYGSGSARLSEMMNNATSVHTTESAQSGNGIRTVQVNVDGINITIQGSGNGIEEDLAEHEDAIVGRIAKMLEQAFENMPIPVTD